MSTTLSGFNYPLQNGSHLPSETLQPSPSSTVIQSTSELKLPQKPRICGQCNQAEFKYTCPACSLRTCSLTCSNQHKVERKCSGKRNRVEYVKLNQYSWGKLMQDYTYLEDVHRLVSDSRNHQSLKTTKNHNAAQDRSGRNISLKRNLLIRKAALEGVQLILMADGMARRKTNTTCFNRKKNCLQWSLEMVFPVEDEKNMETHESDASKPSSKQYRQLIHQVTSDTKVVEILKRTLNIKKTKLTQARKLMLLKILEEQEQSDGEEENLIFVIRIDSFIRSEETIASSTSQAEVHVIDSNSKLVEALNGTKILEWPKIEVWTTAEWTSQISSGRIRILPKTVETGKSQRFQAPVDSGWSNKRARTEKSALDESAKIPEENSTRDSSTDGDLDPDNEGPLALNDPQNSTLIMESLLQYSSSEDDSS